MSIFDETNDLTSKLNDLQISNVFPPIWVLYESTSEKTKIRGLDKRADIDDLKDAIIKIYGLNISSGQTSIWSLNQHLDPSDDVKTHVDSGCGTANNPFMLKIDKFLTEPSNNCDSQADLLHCFLEKLTLLPERCIEEHEIISRSAMNITLRNRESTMSNLLSVINDEANLEPDSRLDKRNHKIPVLSTLSGFGKSRVLLELKSYCQDKHLWQYEYITYNQGFSESGEERKYEASLMLAWRLIYFYFCPQQNSLGQTWASFLQDLEDQHIVETLSVDQAFRKIAADVLSRQTDGEPSSVSGTVVFVIAIDEFQILSPQRGSGAEENHRNRLSEVVVALSTLMCLKSLPFIVIPVFAGLYLYPFDEATRISSVNSHIISLEPLRYDDAAAILVEYSSDPKILLKPFVQEFVWQFSAIPADLLCLYDRYCYNKNWDRSYSEVQSARMSKRTKYLDQCGVMTLCEIIACSITESPVPSGVCSGAYLDGCGVCWFVDRESLRVGVPYCLLSALSKTIFRNIHRSHPVDNYMTAFKESMAEVCYQSEMHRTTDWESIGNLGVAYLALRINSFGLLRAFGYDSVCLSRFLHGALVTGDSGDILLSLSPVTPTVLGAEISSSKTWANRNFVAKTCPGQPVIDMVTFFPGSCYNGIEFDLFLFDQRKLRPQGGLVFQVYKDAVQWCRDYVAQYKRDSEHRVGFIFGVFNPLKKVSSQLLREMNELCQPEALEFYFAMGREECLTHFTVLKEHPSLMPRVYINDPNLTKAKLAVVLEWTYPRERAAAIIKNRPVDGFTSWEQIVLAARLETDGEREIDGSFNSAITIV